MEPKPISVSQLLPLHTRLRSMITIAPVTSSATIKCGTHGLPIFIAIGTGGV